MLPKFVLVVVAIVGLVAFVRAETPVENSVETQFQLDMHVPEAAIASLLPSGWTSNVAAQGPAKDMNMRAIFVDRVTINGPDGRPVGKGTNRLIWLTAPAKDATGANVQVMVGGLTEDPADAPGPFGVFLPATTHSVRGRRRASRRARSSIRRTGRLRRRPANVSRCTSSTSAAWCAQARCLGHEILLGQNAGLLPDLSDRNRSSTSFETPRRIRPTG